MDEVIFFPNGTPAHAEGKTAQLDAEIRFQLTQIAIETNPYFCASRIEMDRQGKSFAYDTIRQFQADSESQTEFYFIVGADSMLDIMTWYRGGELFELCRFVAASRPGFDLEKAKTRLTEAQIARVVWLEVPGLHIASRDLRSRVQRGEPIRYLVPDGVAEHIAHLGLYQGKDEEHHR